MTNEKLIRAYRMITTELSTQLVDIDAVIQSELEDNIKIEAIKNILKGEI